MKTKYYLAYGSNLNVHQMAYRCPTAEPVGTAALEGWRLEFRGSKSGAYLTIVPCAGGRVPVGVWEITEDDEKALDHYEGFPRFYHKKTLKVKMEESFTHRWRRVSALVYIMREDAAVGIPTHDYVLACRVGCDHFGIGKGALYSALDRAYKEMEDVI